MGPRRRETAAAKAGSASPQGKVSRPETWGPSTRVGLGGGVSPDRPEIEEDESPSELIRSAYPNHRICTVIDAFRIKLGE